MMGNKKKTTVVDSLSRSSGDAIVRLSPEAMAKMLFLTMFHKKEIAWHGCGKKIEKGAYQIDDIFLYPHKTYASSVKCIDELYVRWFENMAINGDEKLDNLCFHGHSHVDMPTRPSGVDTDFQDDTIEMLQPDGFYIFIIINKSFDFYIKIVDREDGLIYESENVYLGTTGGELCDIFEEYREMVDPKMIDRGVEYGHE